MPDAFPSTMQEWIMARLDVDGAGLQEVATHLMETYSRPLQVYWLGSSFRTPEFEARDVVAGFFADRLSKPEWLQAWSSSGLRLRRWLMNGLLMYLHEQHRATTRFNRLPEIALPNANDNCDAAMEYDRAWARQVVSNACDEAANRCRAANLDTHWDLFRRHYLLGESYGDIVRSSRITARQAEVRCRAARSRFVAALRETLRQDGANEDELDDEIRGLMEVLG